MLAGAVVNEQKVNLGKLLTSCHCGEMVRCSSSSFNLSLFSGTTTKVVTEERMETKKERERRRL